MHFMNIGMFTLYTDFKDACQKGHTFDGVYMTNPDNQTACIPRLLQHEC